MSGDFGSAIPLLCCAGLVLFFAVAMIPFLALLFRSGRKRQQLRAMLAQVPSRSVATLRPDQGLVLLRGTISQVPDPVQPFLDIAVLRLSLRIGIGEKKQEMDRVQARPFLLDDGTGTVWVDPAGLDPLLIGGEGIVPTGQERLDALQAVGLPPSMAEGFIQVWALRAGEEVTVVGTVQERDGQMFVGKGPKTPLVVSTGGVPEMVAQAGRQTRTVWIVVGVLGVIGLCMLTVLVVALGRVLQVLLKGG